ncbi:MAG: amidohydrolase, partial [Acidobacteriota bacterium]
MKRLAISLLATLILISSCLPGIGQTVGADLVITNANVRTMDAKRTSASSIAILNGKIIAIGTDADTKALIGPQTRVINAGGKLVLPGFN